VNNFDQLSEDIEGDVNERRVGIERGEPADDD